MSAPTPVAQHVATSPLPEEFETEVASLEAELAAGGAIARCPAALVRRLLLDTSGYLQGTLLDDADGHWKDRIEAARGPAGGRRLPGAGRRDLGPLRLGPPRARAAWPPSRAVTATTASDRIDRVLTHRLWGTLVFAVVMVLMFQSVFVWARPATDAIESAHGARPAIGSGRTWPKGRCEACWPMG